MKKMYLQSNKYNMTITLDKLTNGVLFYSCRNIGKDDSHITVWLLNIIGFKIPIKNKVEL